MRTSCALHPQRTRPDRALAGVRASESRKTFSPACAPICGAQRTGLSECLRHSFIDAVEYGGKLGKYVRPLISRSIRALLALSAVIWQLRGLLLVGSQSDIRVPRWCGSGPNQAPARSSWASAQDGRLLSRRAAGLHIPGGADPCRGRDAARGSHQCASSRRRWFPGGLSIQLSSKSRQSCVTIPQP